MSTMTAATLSTVVALAIGLVLIAFFPGAVARVLTHIPGRSDHVLEAEEADALNAALALPDTAVQSPETIENVPEKYRVFVLSRPIETRVQFAFMNDDLVFRIPRTETLKVTQVGVTVFNFLLAIPGLLLFLLGVLGFQLVCLSGIQLQFTLIYDDPRSATIIAVLSAVFILTFLFEIYIVTNTKYIS